MKMKIQVEKKEGIAGKDFHRYSTYSRSFLPQDYGNLVANRNNYKRKLIRLRFEQREG